MSIYDPDNWALSLWRSLKAYVDTKLDLDIYDVVFGYPSADELTEKVPIEKTIIHFDFEEVREGVLGFGDNFVDFVRDETPPPTGQTIEYWEAKPHEIDWDIGIWASAQSSGVTGRLQARSLLSDLFTGSIAYRNCLASTDGVHIKRFGGGRNLIDAIGDIPLWRMVDISLTTHVFSRAKLLPPIPYIGDIDDVEQDQQLEIGGIPIVE